MHWWIICNSFPNSGNKACNPMFNLESSRRRDWPSSLYLSLLSFPNNPCFPAHTLRTCYALLFSIFLLESTDRRHSLAYRWVEISTILSTLPRQLQCWARSSVEGHQAGSAAGCLQPCPSALASFLLAFHIISLFKTLGNSQHYNSMIYLLIC